METINERLAVLPSLLKYETPAALAKACGIDPNTMRKAMQGPSKPSFDLLQAVLAKHKALSSDWLMLGVGSVLKDGQAQTSIAAAPSTEKTSTQTAEPAGAVVTSDEIRSLMSANSSAELRQVTSERDQLRRYVDTLLAMVGGKPSPPNELSTTSVNAGGQLTGSEHAADKTESAQHVEVYGLVRYASSSTSHRLAWVDATIAEMKATPLATRVRTMWKEA